MIACTIIIILTLVRSSSRAGSTSARRTRRRRNISVMLITINLVFISLTAPIVIFLSVNEYFKETNNRYRQTILVLIKIICIILMNLNHAVNIIVYSSLLHHRQTGQSERFRIFAARRLVFLAISTFSTEPFQMLPSEITLEFDEYDGLQRCPSSNGRWNDADESSTITEQQH